MPSNPSVVLVHGSWVTPSFYSELIEQLEGHGYPTVCPLLPTCSPLATSNTDLIDDALAIRELLTRLIEYENKSVIVLMHSYGGLVGSEAIPEELTSVSRQRESLAGGVQHLIYMGAFILPAGQSCQSFFGDMPGSIVKDGFYTDPDAKIRMFNDMPSDKADAYVAKMVRHPFKVQQTTTTRAAYNRTPSTYIVFERDGACPPPAQEQFVGLINARMIRLDAGHMAPLSQPVQLGDVVNNAIRAAV